ncbi:hypothetical protein P5673_007914 [Acropora cervicornis]|uniref:Uncharacterized protein n=1 Tax=Acropora cervicornis TaxID=6130 RepID=A0AAD9VB45_ACRCE|nr:hypothetical protein P5673_007914 [Acropora cervicornis]
MAGTDRNVEVNAGNLNMPDEATRGLATTIAGPELTFSGQVCRVPFTLHPDKLELISRDSSTGEEENSNSAARSASHIVLHSAGGGSRGQGENSWVLSNSGETLSGLTGHPVIRPIRNPPSYEKDRGRVWKEHMERIMNEENEWDQNMQADLVEGPVERVGREEVVKVLGKMKAEKAAGPSVEMC